MRYHELALQYWLNSLFVVREGYPVPVVFSSPMDAFSYFQQLWSDANNPFQYLFDLKDERGTPLYEPHPSPVRYPIISAYRKGWKYRNYQNFSIHRWRHLNWPTVANAGTERYGPQADGWDITKCQLGNVTTSRMPMAWDYRFQIDHFCNRPDTQAFFIEQLMQEFWRTGGPVPQTWITVPYPGWGNRRVRLYLDGDIESLTPEEPESGKNVEFRTSFTLVIEGFDVDLRYQIYPALWNLVFRFGPVAPIELNDCFNFTKTVDVRVSGSNTTLDSRPNVPTWGTCQNILRDIGGEVQNTIEVVGINETANNNFGVFTIGTTIPNFVISGSVTEFGAGVSVPLDVQGIGTVVSSVAGVYSVTVPLGYSGTVLPISTIGNFTPPFRTYVGVALDYPNQDYAFIGTTHVAAFGTDYAASGGTFVYGSADLFVNYAAGNSSVMLLGGTVFDAAVDGGTFVGSTFNVVSFVSGTLLDSIVYSFGTDYSAGSVALLSGTLFDAIVSAGTLTDSGSLSVSFYNGTITLIMIETGTKFAQSALQVSFLNGTCA